MINFYAAIRALFELHKGDCILSGSRLGQMSRTPSKTEPFPLFQSQVTDMILGLKQQLKLM